jgi:hypothetical protein
MCQNRAQSLALALLPSGQRSDVFRSGATGFDAVAPEIEGESRPPTDEQSRGAGQGASGVNQSPCHISLSDVVCCVRRRGHSVRHDVHAGSRTRRHRRRLRRPLGLVFMRDTLGNCGRPVRQDGAAAGGRRGTSASRRARSQMAQPLQAGACGRSIRCTALRVCGAGL